MDCRDVKWTEAIVNRMHILDYDVWTLHPIKPNERKSENRLSNFDSNDWNFGCYTMPVAETECWFLKLGSAEMIGLVSAKEQCIVTLGLLA